MRKRQGKPRAKFLLISLAAAVVAGAMSWYALSIFIPENQPNNQTAVKNDPVTPEVNKKTDPLTCVANIPLTSRIGQKLMPAGYSDQLAAEISTLVKQKIGGVIIMDETDPAQISDLKSSLPIAPFIAVDQEGGTVQRYKSEGVLPGAEQLAETESVDSAYDFYLQDSNYLKTQGITTNFAPVVDVISHLPSPLPGRMYSDDPQIVADYAAASIKAMQAAGITPVIKHFPGLGSASGNTDFVATTTDPLDTLESRDLIPYKKLAELKPDVMVGNMMVPGLTDNQPAIWSKPAIDLLRSLGYKDSVIYSDSLTAKAIPGSLADAATKTWQAGIDVALIVQDREETTNLDSYLESIISSAAAAVESGEISEDSLNASVLRILSRKQVNPCDEKYTTTETSDQPDTVSGKR